MAGKHKIYANFLYCLGVQLFKGNPNPTPNVDGEQGMGLENSHQSGSFIDKILSGIYDELLHSITPALVPFKVYNIIRFLGQLVILKVLHQFSLLDVLQNLLSLAENSSIPKLVQKELLFCVVKGVIECAGFLAENGGMEFEAFLQNLNSQISKHSASNLNANAIFLVDWANSAPKFLPEEEDCLTSYVKIMNSFLVQKINNPALDVGLDGIYDSSKPIKTVNKKFEIPAKLNLETIRLDHKTLDRFYPKFLSKILPYQKVISDPSSTNVKKISDTMAREAMFDLIDSLFDYIKTLTAKCLTFSFNNDSISNYELFLDYIFT
jgi:hypothetical protein